MACVSLTRMDRSCPLSSKKTCLWPARFRSLTAKALMCSVLPRSSSTCREGVGAQSWGGGQSGEQAPDPTTGKSSALGFGCSHVKA